METNKVIKIVFIVEVLTKGVGKHVIDLYKYLNNNDKYAVYVLYGEERSDIDFLNIIDDDKKICIKSLKSKLGLCDIKAYFEIKKVLKRIKPDIVHCHSSKAGFSGRIAAKKVGINQIIYSPHAYYFLKYDKKFNIKKTIFILAEKILSKYFTSITITTSVKEDEVYLNYSIDAPNKRVLIEHGIELPIIEESDKEREKEKYNIKNEIVIGAMARFVEQKDPVGTYLILKKLAKNTPNVKCIFWGDGEYYKKIKEMNNSEGNYVMLPGETKNADLSLSILDIYLTASLYEGLPYTLIETLSLAKPIVSSKVVGNEDCVLNDKNGLLFEAKDYNQAVKNIQRIIKENSFQKYGRESKKIFENRFSSKKMLNKYNKLYRGDFYE